MTRYLWRRLFAFNQCAIDLQRIRPKEQGRAEPVGYQVVIGAIQEEPVASRLDERVTEQRAARKVERLGAIGAHPSNRGTPRILPAAEIENTGC